MYEPKTATAGHHPATRALLAGVALLVSLASAAPAQIITANESVIRKISSPNEKLELTTNTSRILTLEKRIPRVQVNNPDLLSVTPLSATQIQVSAKKAGVTAVNLWDEDGQVHSVDVFIYGDVRELQHALQTQFPNSSIRVYRYSNALVLTGFIDRPDFVTPIVELAQDYSPKVINNISVGGVQQVLLKVKVFEVSRTKLRRLGADISLLNSSGGFFSTGVSGLISNTTNGLPGAIQTITDSAGQTVEFGIVKGSQQFFGLLDALQENNLAKILAEPNIVAVSGRPALFNEGGEIPILIPQGLGQVSIEYKKFGTQVDFLPIVLGNGNIRLEVRPRISDLDSSNGISLDNTIIPALTVREVDTAVEMKAGQTFALAGLIQRRTEAINRGIPYLSDVPIFGVPFRKVEEEVNEIELLILVTPEFVDAMDPHQVPRCYPGSGTMSPDNCELYWGGHVEVPNRCNGCGPCGCVPTHGHEPCCPQGPLGMEQPAGGMYPGSGYESMQHGYGAPVDTQYVPADPSTLQGQAVEGPVLGPAAPVPSHEPVRMPAPIDGNLALPPLPTEAAPAGAGLPPAGPAFSRKGNPQNASRYAASRKPAYQRQASKPYKPTPGPAALPAPDASTGLIGPVGYDAE